MNLKFALIILFGLFMQDRVSFTSDDAAQNNCEPYVNVHGSTNLSKFDLENSSPIVVREVSELKEMKDLQPVKIPVDSFKTSKKKLKKNLNEMLEVNKHPYIVVNVERRKLGEFRKNKQQELKTLVNIAGIVHNYTVPCSLDSCENSSYFLKGSLDLILTDFGIEPPKMLLGIVKVKNIVQVDFGIKFKEDDPIFNP